jgi:signal transduction histidine kinase
MREVSQVLMGFSGCDAVEVRLSDGDLHYRLESTQRPADAVRFELTRWIPGENGQVIPASRDNTDMERLCRVVACQSYDSSQPFFTSDGSFWTGDAWEPLVTGSGTGIDGWCVGGHYRSLAVMRFFVDDNTIGLLLLKNEQPNYFSKETVEFYEGAAQMLGLAVANRRAQVALRERIKELTCLYGIARIVERVGSSMESSLQQVVELLPSAWQYPQSAVAKIHLDGRTYATQDYGPVRFQQSTDIVIGGNVRGCVQVGYLEERPEMVGGAFLEEEENLIDAIAKEVAGFVERKAADEERAKLQNQLIHADRLATIGQLAAGVAHELNEPLGSILGFAQLAQKCRELPGEVEQDIEKIVGASLYAREVIRKLMVFARQLPPRNIKTNLNEVVEEGMYFLEARCVKKGIEVVWRLSPDLPEIMADPAQLKQVLVNLVVNAVQAMPRGGTLTIGTWLSDAAVFLGVTDSGSGMSEEVRGKVFLPFFTTKDVNEGTGLGLAVVHGIVTSHGGSVEVESRPGQGAQFTIRIPVVGTTETQEASLDDTQG